MGKDRRTLSMKELISSNDEGTISIETERMPRYITKKPAFSCPLSPHILWHHGLQYSDCPIVASERDMPECVKCIHRGDSKVKVKSSKRSKSRRKKSNPKVEKRAKERTPNIGKTYVSE
jgi:hypothetical protein